MSSNFQRPRRPGSACPPFPRRRTSRLGLVAAVVSLGSGALCLPAMATVTISGRLVAPAGTPHSVIAEARVELRPAGLDYQAARRQLAGEAPAPPLAAVRPAPDGSFTLAAPRPGCYRVAVEAAGMLPLETVLAPLLEDTQLLPAVLTLAGRLTMRAVGPDGQPVPGVQLFLQRTEHGLLLPAPPGWAPAERSGRTGPDGRLALPRAAGENVLIFTLDPRFLGEMLQLPATTAAGTAAEVTAATLRLERRPALVLEVHAPAGEPVPGALLRSGGRPIAIAASDGRLELALGAPLADLAATLESPDGLLTAEVSGSQARGGRLRIALRPAREIAGRLLDAATARPPASGGLVWTEWAGALFVAPTQLAASSPVTSGGAFLLRVPPGPGVRLQAAAPGFLTATVATLPESTAPLDVRLQPAVAMAGLVVDGSGRGVPGARIEASDGRVTGKPIPPAFADPTGGFLLPALAAGRLYRLAVSAAGFAPSTRLARAPRATPSRQPGAAAQEAPLRIVLTAGRSVTGKTVDGSGRELVGVSIVLANQASTAGELAARDVWRWTEETSPPADPAAVAGTATAFAPPATDTWRTRSGAHGTFELPHLAPGTYRLLAGGADFATTDLHDLDLAPGATGRLDLGKVVLEPDAAIEGVVVDRQGNPVADAVIAFALAANGTSITGPPQLGAGWDSVSSGPDGRFRIADLRRGQHLDLTASHSSHAPARVENIQAPPPRPLRVELPDGARLTGRVTDAGGQAVLGARITAAAAGSGRGFSWGNRLDATPSAATSDALGQFEITGLAPGSCDLGVTASGFRRWSREGFQVAAAEPTQPIEIVLDSGASLAGRVSDRRGRAAADVGVLAFPDITSMAQAMRGAFPAYATADDDGRYLLTGLEPGRFHVSVAGSRTSAPAFEIRPGANELDLVTDRPDSSWQVSGKITDETGTALGGAQVWLEPAREPATFSHVESLADGSFLFGDVEPGAYRLWGAARGYVPDSLPDEVAVADAAIEDLALALRPAGGAVTGQISGLEPEALARAVVVATAYDLPALPDEFQTMETRATRAPGTVDAAGWYRIGDLAPGTWQVSAVSGAGRSAGGRVTLAPDQVEARLDLDLGGALTLSGKVSIDQRPVSGATVFLGGVTESQPAGTARTAADGSFSLSNLKPGSYVVAVIDPPALLALHLPIELDADRDLPIEVATGSVKGRVVLAASGDAVAGATVKVDSASLGQLSSLFMPPPVATAEDGSFQFDSLPEGLYHIKAVKPGLAPGEASVQVPAQDTVRTELALAPGHDSP